MGTLDTLLSNDLLTLGLIVGLGLLVGRIGVGGINLGSSGVLFVGLAFGHFGYTVPGGVGEVGLVLFVYCVGLSAGRRFFRVIVSQGSTLAQLGLILVVSGAAVAWACAVMLDLPADLATGLYAGALTSTPALAAGLDSLGAAGSLLPIGYGIAYPLGVIGVVLFVQLAPRLLGGIDAEAAAAPKPDEAEDVEKVLVEVTNPQVTGRVLEDVHLAEMFGTQPTRLLKEGRLVPVPYPLELQPGHKLLLVGPAERLEHAVEYLGQRADDPIVLDTERERQLLVVTAREVIGQALGDLKLRERYGVTISRINRMGAAFVPQPTTVIEHHDHLRAIGEPENLARVAKLVGHRSTAVDATDVLSLAVGLTLGVFVGMIPLALPDSPPLTLGLAGGPLLVALVLGHFGRIGRVAGYIPRSTRTLMQEAGLVCFLADAGVRGGARMGEALTDYGAALFVAGAAITLLPLLLGALAARYLYKLDLLQMLGGICGGMTSTPALGVITARTDAQAPVVAYAAAYPVALILMTIAAKLLIGVLGG